MTGGAGPVAAGGRCPRCRGEPMASGGSEHRSVDGGLPPGVAEGRGQGRGAAAGDGTSAEVLEAPLPLGGVPIDGRPGEPASRAVIAGTGQERCMCGRFVGPLSCAGQPPGCVRCSGGRSNPAPRQLLAERSSITHGLLNAWSLTYRRAELRSDCGKRPSPLPEGPQPSGGRPCGDVRWLHCPWGVGRGIPPPLSAHRLPPAGSCVSQRQRPVPAAAIWTGKAEGKASQLGLGSHRSTLEAYSSCRQVARQPQFAEAAAPAILGIRQ
jgi:hypothetical protein